MKLEAQHSSSENTLAFFLNKFKDEQGYGPTDVKWATVYALSRVLIIILFVLIIININEVATEHKTCFPLTKASRYT